MDRYKITPEGLGEINIDNDDSGEWVRYEDIDKLQADNKRLREALERIAEDWEEGGWNGWNTCLAHEALQQGEK